MAAYCNKLEFKIIFPVIILFIVMDAFLSVRIYQVDKYNKSLINSQCNVEEREIEKIEKSSKIVWELRLNLRLDVSEKNSHFYLHSYLKWVSFGEYNGKNVAMEEYRKHDVNTTVICYYQEEADIMETINTRGKKDLSLYISLIVFSSVCIVFFSIVLIIGFVSNSRKHRIRKNNARTPLVES